MSRYPPLDETVSPERSRRDRGCVTLEQRGRERGRCVRASLEAEKIEAAVEGDPVGDDETGGNGHRGTHGTTKGLGHALKSIHEVGIASTVIGCHDPTTRPDARRQ